MYLHFFYTIVYVSFKLLWILNKIKTQQWRTLGMSCYIYIGLFYIYTGLFDICTDFFYIYTGLFYIYTGLFYINADLFCTHVCLFYKFQRVFYVFVTQYIYIVYVCVYVQWRTCGMPRYKHTGLFYIYMDIFYTNIVSFTLLWTLSGTRSGGTKKKMHLYIQIFLKIAEWNDLFYEVIDS